MATLLIVEDDKQTNEAICEYLKSAGHKLVPAYDGTSALQLFSQEAIDLVVLDIMLPKISGLGVLHEIRQKSSIPVLMLTALGDEHTQVTSFDEQADDYITKPFSMVLLGRRITTLLRRSGKGVTLVHYFLINHPFQQRFDFNGFTRINVIQMPCPTEDGRFCIDLIKVVLHPVSSKSLQSRRNLLYSKGKRIGGSKNAAIRCDVDGGRREGIKNLDTKRRERVPDKARPNTAEIG